MGLLQRATQAAVRVEYKLTSVHKFLVADGRGD